MTEAVTAPPTLKFDIPGAVTTPPPLDIPDAVPGQIATGLATVATTEDSRQAIICKDMVNPATLANCKKTAINLVQSVLDPRSSNTDLILTFGLDALKEVNDLIDVMLKQIKATDMGPVADIMKAAYLNMQNIKGKYDLNTPSGKKAYDEWQHSFINKLIHRGRNYFESMHADMLGVDGQLDKLGTDLKGRYVNTRTTIKYLDQLYDKNEVSIYALIDRIATMELFVELAQQQAQAMPDIDPVTKQENETKKRLVDTIMQMQIKTGEYKGRLFVAWATSPQLRMMRVLDVGMAEKLNEAVNVTIYNIKLALVQWRTQAQAVENAKATQNLDQVLNQTMVEVAAAGATTASIVMNAVQTPSILPETITSVTDSLSLMATNILEAIQAGAQKRTELETTMAQSKTVLNSSQGAYNAELVNVIVNNSTKPFELPASKPTLAITAG